jgi:hypothetical protein
VAAFWDDGWLSELSGDGVSSESENFPWGRVGRRADTCPADPAAESISLKQSLSRVAPFIARNPLLLAAPIGVVLAFAIYFVSRSRGYFPDEGSFCTVAQGLLHGRLPYRDLFNEKPPLQYFWTAAVMAISRPALAGARLASTLALAFVLSCILHGPARRISQPAQLAVWAILTPLVAMDMFAFNNTAESSLAVLFGLSALLLRKAALGEAPAGKSAAALGFLSGLSIGFRQSAIVPALLLMFPPNKNFLRSAYCGGLAAGLLCWLVPLFMLGIGRDFFHSTIGFHLNNPSAMSYLRGPSIVDIGAGLLWILCLGWLASLRANSRGLPWLLLWLVALGCSAFFRMDAFRLWPSTAAALVMIAHEVPARNTLTRIASVATALAALLLLIGFHPGRSGAQLQLSNAIARATRPEDRVWVGPFNPVAYCLAQRQPASRYYFILPWTAKTEVRQRIIADIAVTRPRLIVLNERDEFDISKTLPEVVAIVSRRYHPIRTFGGAVFYERNGF